MTDPDHPVRMTMAKQVYGVSRCYLDKLAREGRIKKYGRVRTRYTKYGEVMAVLMKEET